MGISYKAGLQQSRASLNGISKTFQILSTNKFQMLLNLMVRFSESDNPTSLVPKYVLVSLLLGQNVQHPQFKEKVLFFASRLEVSVHVQ